MQIAVIGANGQVGSDLMIQARAGAIPVVAFTHADFDIRDREAVDAALQTLGPDDVVINTAAFHRTEECETRADLAFGVNAAGAYNVAKAAAERHAAVVAFSSDYVFDGRRTRPYTENAAPAPLNVYGASRYAGELCVALANARHYIIRISSVFGVAGSSGKGGNFVENILSAARSAKELEVVDDIVMAPTASADAAQLLVSLLRMGAPFGVYHLANGGACSWNAFANAALELAGMERRAKKIVTADRPSPIRRPRYSVLASAKLQGLGLRVRPWREALADYLTQRGYTLSPRAS